MNTLRYGRIFFHRIHYFEILKFMWNSLFSDFSSCTIFIIFRFCHRLSVYALIPAVRMYHTLHARATHYACPYQEALFNFLFHVVSDCPKRKGERATNSKVKTQKRFFLEGTKRKNEKPNKQCLRRDLNSQMSTLKSIVLTTRLQMLLTSCTG